MFAARPRTITFDAALRDLSSDDPRVRVAAADALGDLPYHADLDGNLPGARAALSKTLTDERLEVRCSAALSLAEIGDASVVAPLVARLRDESPEVRQAATIALGRIGDQAAFDSLREALREGPPDVRFQAAISLVEIDPDRAYEPLVSALADGDAEVRGNAAAGLGQIGDRRAAGWIVELLGDARRETRFEAACALAELSDARALEPLCEFLRRGDTAYAAIEGLEAIGDVRAVPSLAMSMRRLLADRILRIRAAGAVLALDSGGVDSDYAKKLLEKAAKSRREDLRGLAEELLARRQDVRPFSPARSAP